MSGMMKSAAAAGALFLLGKSKASGWDYSEPSEWSHHYEFCGTNDQSPIDISSTGALYAPDICGPQLNWTVDWSVHDFRISNNGHSIVLKPVRKSTKVTVDADLEATYTDDDDVSYTTVGTSENAIGVLHNHFAPEDSPHTEFCLDSFHFHWGITADVGSEHLLDGEQFPMEVHFVHYACDAETLGGALAPYSGYSNVTAAAAMGYDYHELAVVGIFFELTDYDNPAFDAILSEETLEAIQYPNAVDSSYATEKIVHSVYLQDLIPMDLFTAGYYAYEGSLTTPPCTDIVRWHVSNVHSYIGKTQIERFRQIMSTTNVSSAENYRPVQINSNPVYACMDEVSTEEVRSAAEVGVVVAFAILMLICMTCFALGCWWRSKREANQPSPAPQPKQRPRVFSVSSAGSVDIAPTHSQHLSVDGGATGRMSVSGHHDDTVRHQ